MREFEDLGRIVSLGDVHVTSRLVTFSEVICPTSTGNCRHHARTVDLRSGEVVREGESSDDEVALFGAPSGSFVLWTDTGGFRNYLYVVGPEGSEEVVEAQNVNKDTVAVGDGIVYWTYRDDGTVSSAPVP
jgi:hypothetical protein